jgi:hypothetical protein
MMSVRSIPLSQFKPANFTDLPESHHPDAWLETLPTSRPRVTNDASKFFLYFMIRRSKTIVGALLLATNGASECHQI